MLLLAHGWLKKKRGSWRLDRWLCQIFDIFIELGCSIGWVPCLANQVANGLVGAEQLISFIGDYMSP